MNTTTIQDGVYPAHLIAAEAKISASGHPLIAFLWKLDETGQTVKSFLHLCYKDGTPNPKGIAFTKAWAPDWDGKNLYWFSENLALASTYPVKLTIENTSSWGDSHSAFPNVKWVNSLHWQGKKKGEGEGEGEEAQLVKPDDEIELEPTMHETWRLWSVMCANCSLSYRDREWIKAVRAVRPDADQIDFTADDWRKVQEIIRYH